MISSAAFPALIRLFLPKQERFIPRGMLTWHQANAGGKLPAIAELLAITRGFVEIPHNITVYTNKNAFTVSVADAIGNP